MRISFFLLAMVQVITFLSSFGQSPSLRAGFNASTIMSSVSSGNRILPGFYFGVAASKVLKDKASLGVELVYSLQGTKADNVKAKYSYINMPLLFSFGLDNKMEVCVGPQIGMIFNAVIKGSITENVTPKLNTLDLAMVGGLKFSVSDFFKIETRINYGLSNTVRNPVPDGSYRNFVIQLGGVFSFKKKTK
jgi:Outer membrane protein beta-barrel domain